MAAVTTEAQVCNLALGLVGQRQFLDSLDEATTEAQVCKTYFASVRASLFQAFGWRFATKRATLALTAEARTGWAYAYQAPADMLLEAPARLWDGNRAPGEGEKLPFDVELNDAAAGHLVLTDEPDAVLLYTVEVRAVALWPPLFVDAVAAALAVRLAGALPVKPALIPMLETGARLALQRAAAASANAVTRDVPADSEMIRERS